MSDHLQQGPHEGGCLCGQVRFSVDAAPLGARMCWCRDCQRIASGSATVNVLFPAEAFSFTGEIATYHRSADSGNVVERGFCPECGAQIFSRPLDNPGQPIRLRAGVLDNPNLIAPQAIIWTASAPSWVKFDPDLPAYPKAPPAAPHKI